MASIIAYTLRLTILILPRARPMNLIKSIILPVIVVGAFVQEGHSTDRFYSDISAKSPSKRYVVEAKSPDNSRKNERGAFQSSFVYTCRDTITKKVLWTRRQAMGKPERLTKDSTETLRLPEEASPVDIFVSDTGWTVIRTGWDELIPIDVAGHEKGRVGLLSQGFTKKEKSKYVQDSTAGPMWSGFSLWYFLDVGDRPLFVVRPWWGRRVVLNLESGKLLDETREISKSAAAYERQSVMTELTKAVKTRKQWENEECCEAVSPILNASYLAGRLPVPEAVPLLESLQDSSYQGSSTIGGMGFGERFEGEVNPHDYGTFTLRQVVQLSLRRLGKSPRPFEANQFRVEYKDYKKNRPYSPKPLVALRETNVDNVKIGMKAEQVLGLLGGPDFVERETWEYDMDANPPFSLILKWDVRHVIGIQKKKPVLWKQGLTRDQQIVR